jgi:protein disulfide-isomerase A1
MRFASAVTAVAVLALAAVAVQASDVLVLTTESFKNIVPKEEAILVEFFAPWCGHCKALAPKWEEAATKLKEIAKIASVDCTAENNLCTEYGVRGYPTIKLFRKGEASDYSSARETDAIVSFMKKQVSPPFVAVDEDKLEEFSQSDRVVVVAFLNEPQGPDYDAVNVVAHVLRDSFTFAYVLDTDASSAAKYGASVPSVVLFKKFDEGKNVLDGALDQESVLSFVQTNAVPTMDDVGPENYSKYVESGLPLAYLFVGSDEHRRTYGPAVEAVAKEFKGKVNFVYLDAAKYGGHASNLNLKQEWPAFGIQHPQLQTKFPFDQSQTITEDAIRQFVTDFSEGKVLPSLKSEEIPEVQDGPVFVLVGKNFLDVVSQPKDVLVEFYAPWCGHCKKLEPIFAELGEKLKPYSDKVTIAKMDATANDVPPEANVNIAGFPTIKLFRADGNVVDYDGDRSLEHMLLFLQRNSVVGASLKIDGIESFDDDDDDDDKDEL